MNKSGRHAQSVPYRKKLPTNQPYKQFRLTRIRDRDSLFINQLDIRKKQLTTLSSLDD